MFLISSFQTILCWILTFLYENRSRLTLPLEVLNTMTLTENNSKTLMTLHGIPINATAEERRHSKMAMDQCSRALKGTLNQA